MRWTKSDDVSRTSLLLGAGVNEHRIPLARTGVTAAAAAGAGLLVAYLALWLRERKEWRTNDRYSASDVIITVVGMNGLWRRGGNIAEVGDGWGSGWRIGAINNITLCQLRSIVCGTAFVQHYDNIVIILARNGKEILTTRNYFAVNNGPRLQSAYFLFVDSMALW